MCDKHDHGFDFIVQDYGDIMRGYIYHKTDF